MYAVTARFLTDGRHDVVLVSQICLSQATDKEILEIAQERNRILVTRDRDYGNLVFAQEIGTGVIYLRILPTTVKAVHTQLAQVLEDYSEVELANAFVVIEPNGYRFRKPLA